jgi:hypothetical protein
LLIGVQIFEKTSLLVNRTLVHQASSYVLNGSDPT